MAVSFDSGKGIYSARHTIPVNATNITQDRLSRETYYDVTGEIALYDGLFDYYETRVGYNQYIYGGGVGNEANVLDHMDHYTRDFPQGNKYPQGENAAVGAGPIDPTLTYRLTEQSFYDGLFGDRIIKSETWTSIEEVSQIVNKDYVTFYQYDTTNPYRMVRSLTLANGLNLDSETFYIQDPNGDSPDAVLQQCTYKYAVPYALAYAGTAGYYAQQTVMDPVTGQPVIDPLVQNIIFYYYRASLNAG